MLEQREWVREHHDHLRTALMLEPRGHADMYGALLTEPEQPESDAGVLFMHNEGYSTMCGHGVIAVVTLALERGLLIVPRTPDTLVLDTPAGSSPRARRRSSRAGGDVRVRSVSFRNVPSFVLHAGVPVRVTAASCAPTWRSAAPSTRSSTAKRPAFRSMRQRLDDLRRAGMAIKRAVEARCASRIPLEPALHGIYGTIFTGSAVRRSMRICGTSRSSPTPKSIVRRAAPGRAR